MYGCLITADSYAHKSLSSGRFQERIVMIVNEDGRNDVDEGS